LLFMTVEDRNFWVCVWLLGDKIGGWLLCHGCNREISLSVSEEPLLFFALLLLAWQVREKENGLYDLFLWFENICLTN
jgi:formate hydrogenlyase subunit 4